jgi:hypothetical protein
MEWKSKKSARKCYILTYSYHSFYLLQCFKTYRYGKSWYMEVYVPLFTYTSYIYFGIYQYFSHFLSFLICGFCLMR